MTPRSIDSSSWAHSTSNRRPAGETAALLPDSVTPDEVASALGIDHVRVSPAVGRDPGVGHQGQLVVSGIRASLEPDVALAADRKHSKGHVDITPAIGPPNPNPATDDWRCDRGLITACRPLRPAVHYGQIGLLRVLVGDVTGAAEVLSKCAGLGWSKRLKAAVC